jgi:hypothetical protein
MEHGDSLTVDSVEDAWTDDPTWSLLRAYNSRWVIPLFSEHLEGAEGPVSADWFHQKVADALDEQQLRARESADAAGVDADSDDRKTTPAEYCRDWVENGWLIRSLRRGSETGALFRLSPHALQALRLVRELVERESTVTEARLGSVAHAVRQLASMADPSEEAQIVRIEAEIVELERRRDAIRIGGPEQTTSEALQRQLREVVRLTASLPEDFRQLSAMVEQRHRHVARKASSAQVGKGALVDQYLRENDFLEQTSEGRAFRGFVHMLSSHEVDTMRADIEHTLAQPFAVEHMTQRQQLQLESLISSLLAEEQLVQETYLRWTSSLRRFLTRTGADKHQRLLALTERALDAGTLWSDRQRGSILLSDDVLGLGGWDLTDATQMQLWQDRAVGAVEVLVTDSATELPETERAALRLASGTSHAAVAATLDRLFADAPEVTAREVYDATPEEFRRLGLVLSLLDHATEHGSIGDESEDLRILGPAKSYDVTVPRLVFHRPSDPGRGDASPGATPAGASA